VRPSRTSPTDLLDLAARIIETKTGKFDVTRYEDRYENAGEVFAGDLACWSSRPHARKTFGPARSSVGFGLVEAGEIWMMPSSA
jgi:hypothetical protein